MWHNAVLTYPAVYTVQCEYFLPLWQPDWFKAALSETLHQLCTSGGDVSGSSLLSSSGEVAPELL